MSIADVKYKELIKDIYENVRDSGSLICQENSACCVTFLTTCLPANS